MIEPTITRALTAHSSGRLPEAQELYLQVLRQEPLHAQAHHNVGLIYMAEHRLQEGLEHFRQALTLKPNEPQFWLSYIKSLIALNQEHLARQAIVHGQSQGLVGDEVDALAKKLAVREDIPGECVNAIVALTEVGLLDQAEKIALKLTTRLPDFALAWGALGAVYRSSGQFQKSIGPLEKVIELQPTDSASYCNLGSSLFDLAHYDTAVESFRKAIDLSPEFGDAWYFLGNCQVKTGQVYDAIASYTKAIELNGELYVARYNLAILLRENGEVDKAIAELRNVLKLVPHLAEARRLLASAFLAQGRLEESRVELMQILQSNPENSDVYVDLAVLYRQMGDLEKAKAACMSALRISPMSAHAYANLGVVLGDLGDQIGSERAAIKSKELALQKFVEMEPNNPGGHSNLGVFHSMYGRMDDAIECYRRAIALQPDFLPANENLLCALGRLSSLDTQKYLSEAKLWETRVLSIEDQSIGKNRVFKNSTRNSRKLRVGYVSGDFREHAVNYFLEGVLQFHNHQRIETFAISNTTHVDAATRRLRALVDNWIDISEMSDSQAVDTIISNEIDILIDLSGYTGLNRLGVFGRRAAPVQCHYLGYFASTGLSQMDYWIADEVLVPPEQSNQFSEKVFRLPRVWIAYNKRDDIPSISWTPNPNQKVVLGSFNQLSKLTPATLELWAKVLKALPNAVLMLKDRAFDDPINRTPIEQALVAHGIDVDRLELLGSTKNWVDHMTAYNRLDIALDPVGSQSGATTTCDALIMGLPIVTLAGDRMALRMTASLLAGMGHPEWIATSEDDYVNKVVSLASDATLLNKLRETVRGEFLLSAVCDAKGMAVVLEDAYEVMFDNWQSQRKPLV